MFKYLHKLYCTVMVFVTFWIGDVFSRLANSDWFEGKPISDTFWDWYRKFMKISFDYDKKINFWYWKYPTE